MDLNNYNLGDEGLSRICEVSNKELKKLKELNLKEIILQILVHY